MATYAADWRRTPAGGGREPVVAIVVAALALALALLLLGGAAVGLAACALVALLGVSAVNPRAGLFAVVVMTTVLDGGSPIPDGARLYVSLQAYGIPLTPVELVLLFALGGLVMRLLFDESMSFRAGSLLLPIACFTLLVLLGIGNGLRLGGIDMSIMRSETRGLFYLPALYVLGTHTLATRDDLRRLMSWFILAVNVLALITLQRYLNEVRGGDDYQAYELAFPHEDALFCAAGVILVLARLTWSHRLSRDWMLALLAVLPLVALLVMRRRAGMVALDTSLILLCAVLLRDNIRLFLVVVPIALLGLGALLAVTWNEPGGIGQPARSVRTITGSDDVSGRDRASDEYREREEVNVRANIEQATLTGLGFGREYVFYLPVADLSFWPLWRYVPHNSVFWVWMKAGALAFISLLALFTSAVMSAMQIVGSTRADRMKPIAFALAAMVLMFAMFSYVDLGLVTPRTLLWFGAVLGGIGALGIVTRPTLLQEVRP